MGVLTGLLGRTEAKIRTIRHPVQPNWYGYEASQNHYGGIAWVQIGFAGFNLRSYWNNLD